MGFRQQFLAFIVFGRFSLFFCLKSPFSAFATHQIKFKQFNTISKEKIFCLIDISKYASHTIWFVAGCLLNISQIFDFYFWQWSYFIVALWFHFRFEPTYHQLFSSFISVIYWELFALIHNHIDFKMAFKLFIFYFFHR